MKAVDIEVGDVVIMDDGRKFLVMKAERSNRKRLGVTKVVFFGGRKTILFRNEQDVPNIVTMDSFLSDVSGLVYRIAEEMVGQISLEDAVTQLTKMFQAGAEAGTLLAEKSLMSTTDSYIQEIQELTGS